MRKITRTHEGYWHSDQVTAFFKHLAVPNSNDKFWTQGYQHSTINEIENSWTLAESHQLIDLQSNTNADPMNLITYNPDDYIIVRKRSDVSLMSGECMFAPAPSWGIERRYNYVDSAMQKYDKQTSGFVYHIQTVRTARFVIDDEAQFYVKRDDHDSFRFVCQMFGDRETNGIYLQMMER